MKFLADECVSGLIVQHLRKEGFTVEWYHESHPGTEDPQILDDAETSHRILITEDKDFGELIYGEGLAHHGVILLRLEGLSAASRNRIVLDLLKSKAPELVEAFTTVTPGKVRIRRKTDSAIDFSDGDSDGDPADDGE